MKDSNTYKEELVTSVTSFYKSYMLTYQAHIKQIGTCVTLLTISLVFRH